MVPAFTALWTLRASMCSNAATSFVEISSRRQQRIFFDGIFLWFYHTTTPTAKLCTQNLVIFRDSLQPLASERFAEPKWGKSISFGFRPFIDEGRNESNSFLSSRVCSRQVSYLGQHSLSQRALNP